VIGAEWFISSLIKYNSHKTENSRSTVHGCVSRLFSRVGRWAMRVEPRAETNESRRREYRRSAVDDDDDVGVVVVLFLEKPRWSRPSPHRGGVGYDHGPSPAPFMGASRRVVTLPNFTTWSRDTARIPLGITPFPRVSARGCRLPIPPCCANTGVSRH